jgi:NADH dehydrogenase FAD-containing subunit
VRKAELTADTLNAVNAASQQWRVVIVGGGFGGLRAAQALKAAPVDVTLIDRRNYHLFQPLLYQVATGSLSPGEIAAPLRSVLSRQKNARVLLGEVVDLDPVGKHIMLADGASFEYIGRWSAVANIFGAHISGFFAWIIWAFIHLMYLVQFQSRILVFTQWAIQDLTFNRGARLISGPATMDSDYKETAREEREEIGGTAESPEEQSLKRQSM